MIGVDGDVVSKKEGFEFTECVADTEKFFLCGGVLALRLIQFSAEVCNGATVLEDDAVELEIVGVYVKF